MARKQPKNNPKFYTKPAPKPDPKSTTLLSNQNKTSKSLTNRENPIVQVEYRNTLQNKIIQFEGTYINTCGQAVLVKLHKQEGKELSPKLACMIYDKELNADLNPAARLQQISELFQKIASIRGFQTIEEFAKDLINHEIYISIPKMGGLFKTRINGRLYDDPGFLFEFYEESYDLDQFVTQFPTFLTQQLKNQLLYQLLSTYMIIFDNPHSDIRFVHNDLFPANLLVFNKNWQHNLVVIDWAGGGFYHKNKKQFLSTPLVYGRPAYTNILIPYEMNPIHQFFHATTDYFLLASLIFFILSGGENPFVFLRNISEKKILDLIEKLEPILTPYVLKKEPIPYAFPPGPEEWKTLEIEELIRTQNRNDAIIIIRNTSQTISNNFPGLADLFYRSFVLGYKNPKFRPTPQDYFEVMEKNLGKEYIADYVGLTELKYLPIEPPEVDTIPFTLPPKELKTLKNPTISTSSLLDKIQNVMQKGASTQPPQTQTNNNHVVSQQHSIKSVPDLSDSQQSQSNLDEIKAKMKDIFKKKNPNP